MPGERNSIRWKFGFASILFGVLALFVAPDGAQQSSNAPTQDAKPPAFRLRVSSSLVLVPVVVRDAKGQPVAGLRKEDFKVFDRGQEQQIGQFEVESLAPAQPLATSPASTGSANAPSSSTVSEHTTSLSCFLLRHPACERNRPTDRSRCCRPLLRFVPRSHRPRRHRYTRSDTRRFHIRHRPHSRRPWQTPG